MSIYTDLALDVNELLEELGVPLVYSRHTQVKDLVAGTVVSSVALQQTLLTALVPASGEGNVEQLDVAFMSDVRDSKERTLAICSCVGATFRPEAKDTVVSAGTTWLIRGCTPINVDGITDVVYLLSLVLP